MAFPLASSSTSLSRYRIFCISGSSMSWTRCPQMLPVMRERDGFRCGACSKKSSRVIFLLPDPLESFNRVAGKPGDDFVELADSPAFALYLLNVVRIDIGEGHGIDAVRHGCSISVSLMMRGGRSLSRT